MHSKPGEEQGAYIEEFPIGKQIRVILTEVDNNLKKRRVVAEKMYKEDVRSADEIRRKIPFQISIIVPQKKDILYTLLTELIEEDGKASDSIIGVIYVPGDEINAMLTTDKQVYTSDESLQMKLIDYGPTWLFHGGSYLLEIEENGAWVPLNNKGTATLEGHTTSPGRDYTLEIKLDKYAHGKYKISKSVGVEKGDFGATLTASFEIVDK